MARNTGAQTRIGTVFPQLNSLNPPPTLSRAAKRRLKWLDHYAQSNNVALTCRHFDISRSLFYKWQARFQQHGLRGLEDRSRRPHQTRQPTTPLATVDLVRKLRKQHPEYSKYKLAVILERDHGIALSASTIGRIIKRYDLFLTPPVKPKRHPKRRPRPRLPKNFQATQPGDLIEVDVKHLPCLGDKRYGFVAVDRITRQAAVHVATTISSRQASLAWTKACGSFWWYPQAVLTDHGSENLGLFADLLAKQDQPHYFTRVKQPEDKPYVERFIGSLERECIQWGGLVIDLVDQRRVIDEWLVKYHTFRPHQALGYLTPAEQAQKLKAKVSTM